jgi:hypothetical protein
MTTTELGERMVVPNALGRAGESGHRIAALVGVPTTRRTFANELRPVLRRLERQGIIVGLHGVKPILWSLSEDNARNRARVGMSA